MVTFAVAHIVIQGIFNTAQQTKKTARSKTRRGKKIDEMEGVSNI